MAAVKFEDLIKLGTPKSKLDESTNWMNESIKRVRQISPNTFMAANREFLVNGITQKRIGKLFMFFYDPKGKDKMPYYDFFPLVFPFQLHPDGFTGINLHYIPPMLRARLMDALYDLINNDKMDETTRLKMNYNILSSSARFRYFRPCIKRYLFTQTRSRFLQIPIEDWDKAVFLPTERFNVPKQIVFNDSRKLIFG